MRFQPYVHSSFPERMPVSETDRIALAVAVEQMTQRVANIDVQEATRANLADLGFVALLPGLEPMKRAAQVLLGAPIRDLPYPLLQKAANAFGQLEPYLGELRTFNISVISQQGNNPVQVQQGILGRFDQMEAAFWEYLNSVLAYALSWKSEIAPSAAASQAMTILAEARTAVGEVREEKKELDNIVLAAREAAGKVGVSRHAALFATEATENNTAAFRWLVATGVSAAITLIAVAANIGYVASRSGDFTPASALQLALAKLLAFSVLLSTTIWCGRIYRAARHNFIVNRHRQNALSTFESFVQAATDEQTRNAVLLHAAQSVFAPQASGFAPTEGDTAGSPNIVELIRTVAPQSR